MTEPRRGEADGFPRQYATTGRFTRGQPRGLRVAPDGSRVAFLRSSSGRDPVHSLWVLDLASGQERLVADPATLAADLAAGSEPDAERALRERTREGGAGIVSYATDRAVRTAAFSLSGVLYVADLERATAERHRCRDPVVDPRPDPAGRRIAYVSDGALHVAGADTASGVRLTGPAEEHVTWGLAEFIAAEEMGRTRGFWWAPGGDRLAVTRVDDGPVDRWWLGDPADPARAPRPVAYPAAGTPNAVVELHVVDLDGRRVRVSWDHAGFPYLARVLWPEHGPLTFCVQSRDQRALRTYAADTTSGAARLVREDHDQHWIELVPGVPDWTVDGRLVHTVDDADTRRLAVDGHAVTPPALQVHALLHAGADALTITASGADPTATAVWTVPLDGSEPRPLSPTEGVHHAAAGGSAFVLALRDLSTPDVRTIVHSPAGDSEIRSVAERPVTRPRPQLLTLGERSLRGALLLPGGRRPDRPLPVLLAPYGGPHAQRVVQRQDAYLVAQWFADEGFAVLVVDGRGSPGRGPAWERMLAGNLLAPPLEDQVDALRAAARDHPLDLDRVAIRGWSFGGYLAAAAVLRRPDVFHAAVAGAPVTDWSLYDTHYTERYLGTPQDAHEAYRACSLLHETPEVKRPLLLVHGLADDNVVAAHTLRLSGALLGRAHPHQLLPLSGVTHMTPQETVTENLLRLELAFLRDALRVGS